MVNIIAIGRIGILGVGLGIGAALASMPGIAAADPTPNPNSYRRDRRLGVARRFLSGRPNVASPSPIDGVPLLQEGTAIGHLGLRGLCDRRRQ